MANETRLVLDFEPGKVLTQDGGNFSSIEAGNPSAQAQVQQNVVRAGFGNRACKISVLPNVYWNGYLRCLLTKNSDETTGQSYYYAMSKKFPSGADQISHSMLLWELHHPSTLYSISSALSVAPHAITWDNGKLEYRLFAGEGTSRYALQEKKTIGFTAFDVWYDFVVFINFQESNTGTVKVWMRSEGSEFSTDPVVSWTNSPTMPWTQSVRNVRLYTEMGMYNNAGKNASMSDTDAIYITGHRRELTAAAAFASWGGSGGTAPPDDPDPVPVEFDTEPVGFMGGRYAVTGTKVLGSQSDKQRCSKARIVRTGMAAGLGIYVEPEQSPRVENLRLASWADNGSGSDPGTAPPEAVTGALTFVGGDDFDRYEANFLGGPISVVDGQIKWPGMINGGDANEAKIRYVDATGEFRLMDALYANGPVAWDTGNDATFDYGMVIYYYGTQTSGSVPINVVAPAISGTAVVGLRLTADSIGTWSASSITPTLNWQRDNQGNGNFSNIAGETNGNYRVTTDDIGCKIRIVVVCVNDIGASAPSPSNQLGPVVSATVTPGSTGRTVFGGRSVTATRSTASTRRAFEGGGG